MLWKQPYEAKILRDVALPVAEIMSLDGSPVSHERQVWIGGFGFEAATDQGVWWRLFKSDFPRDEHIRKVFIFEKVVNEYIQTALSLVPPSEAERCFLVQDPLGVWRDLIKPDSSSRGFAGILEDASISLLMIGPPTEEAWEEFSDSWRTRT